MADYPADYLVPHVTDSFPTTLTLASGQRIQRAVYGVPMDTVRSRAEIPDPCLLEQLLALVDSNLGPVYAQHAKALYGDQCGSWKERKRQEMVTPGLVYVVYRAVDEETGKEGLPLAFLSLLLTDEPELGPAPAAVVYLMEIHVADIIRGLGLGGTLLREGVAGTVRGARRAHPFIQGTELTVFTDNEGALRLYLRLGMQIAAWSPQDTCIEVHRRTRATRYESRKVTRPTYYLLFWPHEA